MIISCEPVLEKLEIYLALIFHHFAILHKASDMLSLYPFGYSSVVQQGQKHRIESSVRPFRFTLSNSGVERVTSKTMLTNTNISRPPLPSYSTFPGCLAVLSSKSYSMECKFTKIGARAELSCDGEKRSSRPSK